MKKTLSILLAVFLTVSCMVLPAAAVDPEPDASRPGIEIAASPSITASPSTVNIAVGETATITYSTNPAGQSVGLSVESMSHTSFSMNEASSSITVTGNSVGTDTFYLTMKYSGTTYKTLVTVNVTEPVDNWCEVGILTNDWMEIESLTIVKGVPTTVLCAYEVTNGWGDDKTVNMGGTISVKGMIQGSLGGWNSDELEADYQELTLTGLCVGSCYMTMYMYNVDTDEILGSVEIPVAVIEISASFTPASLTVPVGGSALTTFAYSINYNLDDTPGAAIEIDIYDEEDLEIIDLNSDGWTYNAFEYDELPIYVEGLKEGTTELYFRMYDKNTGLPLCEATLPVTVTTPVKELSSVSVTKFPNKTEYFVGDSFDSTGMVVTATYTDGSTRNLSASEYTCTPSTLTTEGKQAITVSYTEGGKTKTDAFNVTVIKPRIEVSQSTLNIKVGETATVTYTTHPAEQGVVLSIVSVSHTNFSQNEEASDVTFTGTSLGTDTLYLTMKYNGQTYKTLITVNVVDPDEPTFTVKETKCSGTVGSTVDVPVIVSDNPGICTAMLSVSYDSSVLELVGYKNGSILTDGFTPGGDRFANPFRVAWNSYTKASSENGTMVTFTFKLKRDLAKGESTAITLACSDTADINLAPVQFRTVNGSIFVRTIISGDVDGDGEVTLKDAALISRYLVGGWNVTIDLDAADVNNSNDVTLVDSALISRYLVGGWGVVLI